MVEGEPFQQTVSAGGVVRKVIDSQIQIVLVRDDPLHDWLLPKGHVEEGESLEAAAEQEVKEETGLKKLRLVKKLGVKERLSAEKDEYKTIHYFLFECEGEGKLPKTVKDNGNTLEPRWFPLHHLPKLYWPEQQEIIRENLHALDDSWYEG
jgi:8-oxo-dGTP pyrophosphatase MutT (NUDIX family)